MMHARGMTGRIGEERFYFGGSGVCFASILLSTTAQQNHRMRKLVVRFADVGCGKDYCSFRHESAST